MPSYEALFAFRTAAKLLGGSGIHGAIKRSVLTMMQEGAIVTTFQNMGELPLGSLRKKCDYAHFFIVQSELPDDRIKPLTVKLRKDDDILCLTMTEMMDVERGSRQCTGSVAHLVLNRELLDYQWNFEGNLMKPVPIDYQRLNPKQTKTTIKGPGVNEMF